MNKQFFFYVCESESEYRAFKGYEDNASIIECQTNNDVDYKFCIENSVITENIVPTVNVIVVNGEMFDAKRKVWNHYNNASEDLDTLSDLMLEFFNELEKIARSVFFKYKINNWQPECVTVITHWGGEPVEKRENAISKAVDAISDERFKLPKWNSVASSNIRREAFTDECNPFHALSTNTKANLPTAEDCEILVQKLPLVGEIEWENVINAVEEQLNEDELKKNYDKLMLKLNH